MVKIKGFKGIRPQKELAEEIASFPYDVINSQEARELVKGNPKSFLHVVKSEVDLPEDIDLYSEKVYQTASDNLQQMISKGWLQQDKKENIYIYRQIMNGHEQYGLVAVASVQDYLDEKIKIHELTREAKEKDRINHVKYTNANTGPVFLTYPAQEEIDKIVAEVVEGKPEYDFTADDGISHTFWVVDDDETIEKLVTLFSKIPYTYVADGHHRSKSAAMVGDMKRKENPNHTGDEEYNWFLSVIFPDNQLKILDYNRVVKDLNGLTVSDFLDKVKEKFDVKPVENKESVKPQDFANFGLYINGQWYALTAKENSYDKNDPVDSLDVSILYNNLLAPILAIGDPRKDERIGFVGGIRGLTELEKLVDSGKMAVAFAMYPTSIKQLMSIADAGKIMPPKSTWFEPKLRSGLIVHDLE